MTTVHEGLAMVAIERARGCRPGLFRHSEGQFGWGRPFNVYVDDRLVGAVMARKTEFFALSPGRHSVFVKLDWYPSDIVSLDLAGGDYVELACGPKPLFNKFFRLFDRKMMVLGPLVCVVGLIPGGLKWVAKNFGHEIVVIAGIFCAGVLLTLPRKVLSRKPGTMLYLVTKTGPAEADAIG
jgi:hypothetical protein